jgi:hypothetical protein
MNDETAKQNLETIRRRASSSDKLIHPAWRAFVKYCAELDYGQIEILKIQDGLPVFAEITRKKIKFSA